MSEPVFLDSVEAVIDLIARRGKLATTATPALAGKPYCPGSGSEGADFEDAMCGSCDEYRLMDEHDELHDCRLGIITAAQCAADVKDPAFPKEWVYDAKGRPTCTAWKKRTIASDVKPVRLCAGAKTSAEEWAAYEAAMGDQL